MSYYGAGDYYRGRSGDLVGLIKKGLSIFGGPIGGAVSAALPTRITQQLPPILTHPIATTMQVAKSGTETFLGIGGHKKHRRMNPANPKALRRAIRREAAFIHLAQSTLKGTGYHITRAHRLPTRKRKG